MLQHSLFRLSSAIVLSGMLSCVQAVELGEPLVRSHIGQPLSADIELTSMASDAAQVQAALADPEVYRGASISMHPALSMLNITVVRRDGKRFLHLASPKVIESEFVHLFFSLTENGRSSVRGTTLWFTPDPNPGPPPSRPLPEPAPEPAVLAAPVAATPRQAASAPVIAPMPHPAPAAQPLACAPRSTAAQAGACAALDSKNAALSARIVELEDKVKVLTVAIQATAEPPAPARPVIKPPLKPAPAKAAGAQSAKPVADTPWLFIGIAGVLMLCLIGALASILLRKRKGEGAAKGATGLKARALIVSVRDRLLRSKKAAPEAAPAAELS